MRRGAGVESVHSASGVQRALGGAPALIVLLGNVHLANPRTQDAIMEVSVCVCVCICCDGAHVLLFVRIFGKATQFVCGSLLSRSFFVIRERQLALSILLSFSIELSTFSIPRSQLFEKRKILVAGNKQQAVPEEVLFVATCGSHASTKMSMNLVRLTAAVIARYYCFARPSCA